MVATVAFDITPLAGHETGVGAFVRSLATTLVAGKQVSLEPYAMTLRGAGELRRTAGDLWPEFDQKLPMPASVLMKLWRRVDAPKIELWTGDVDVVHGTNFVVPPSRSAALVTVHDLTALRYPELCAPTSLQYPELVRRALSSGAHVHTPTAAIANEVVAMLGAVPERVHAIHHGVTPLATTRGTDAASGRRLAGSEEYVLAVGTVEPRKDYPSLVRAFDRIAGDHPLLSLVIAGGAAWGMEGFAEALREARHGDRIRHLGWVDNVARAALIRGARTLAFPSLYEGFGLPPLEAMQESIPVVATGVDAVREVLGDAALIVPPHDVDALADALNLVVSDERRRDAMVQLGRARVDEFTWQRCANEFVQLYEKLGSAK